MVVVVLVIGFEEEDFDKGDVMERDEVEFTGVAVEELCMARTPREGGGQSARVGKMKEGEEVDDGTGTARGSIALKRETGRFEWKVGRGTSVQTTIPTIETVFPECCLSFAKGVQLFGIGGEVGRKNSDEGARTVNGGSADTRLSDSGRDRGRVLRNCESANASGINCSSDREDSIACIATIVTS